MKPEDKLPATIEFTMPDGKTVTVTRDEMLMGLKVANVELKELMRRNR